MRLARSIVAAAALAAAGCHHAFILGPDYASEHLPVRTTSAWPLVESDAEPAAAREETRFLGGAVLVKRGPDTAAASAFPLYWSRTAPGVRESTLFPLYWRRDGAKSGRSVLFPLYYARREGEYASASFLWPVYRAQRFGPDNHRWSVLGFLARRDIDGPDRREFRILEKLYRQKVDGPRRDVSLNPLFSYARDRSADFVSWNVLAGLVGRERRGADTRVRLLYFLRI